MDREQAITLAKINEQYFIASTILRHLTYRLFPRNIIQIYRTYIHSMELCREDSF